MKKRKIAKLFKIGTLLFGVSLLLWNCERDEVLETEKKEFIIKEHSLEDLKINTKFTSTLKLLESRKVASSKNVNSTDIYNFTIVPNNIKEVILEDITSYTLLVKRPFSTPDYFENLVIQLKEGEETKAYIIKYTPNNTIELFEEHNSFNYEGKSNVFPLNLNNLDIFSKGTTGECAPILQTWCSWDTDHVAGPSCYEANDGRLYRKYVEDTNCFESGDVSYGGGGGSSTTNEPDSGDVIVTSPKTWDGTPTTINEGELLASRINNILDFSLSSAELNWLETHISEAKEIQNFLFENTTSEAKTFAEQAIKALANGGEVDFEEQIINNLTEEAKCVYGKLETNNLLKKTLKKFNGVDAPVHLILQEGNLGAGVSGETSYGDNITITLDKEDMKNTPSLWGAHTILHEAIHAEIYRKIRTTSQIKYDPYTKTFSLPDGSRAHFPTLFDYYDKYPNNPQHNYMADYYRTAMEEGLKEYATFIGKTYPDQLYKDIAWGGLHNTNAWDNMYADPIYTQNEQQRILNSIRNFKNSGNNECD